MHSIPQAEGRIAGATWRQRPVGLIFVTALIAVVALAAACGGSKSPGVASIDSTATVTSSTPAADATNSGPLAYSQCMREHGIADFPDPDSNGNLTIQASIGSDLDPDSAQFKAAQNVCQSLQPQPNPEQQKQNQTAMLQYSQCMRDNGIANFPDPDANGGLTIDSSMGIDPQSPQFQAADAACKQYLPGGGKDRVIGDGPSSGKGNSSSGGEITNAGPN